jgi:hypothetical protein
MIRALLAATAVIASSFTPIAIPALVTPAAAVPSPNNSLCTDTRLLGPWQNGHHWAAYILSGGETAYRTTFEGPYSNEAGTYWYATTVTYTRAVIQRCAVLNRANNDTNKYQDVEAVPRIEISSDSYYCQEPGELTNAGQALGYVECPAGGSPDDR